MAPANKLSEPERAHFLALVDNAAFASQPTSEIVLAMVNRGEYVASESTIYGIVNQYHQQAPAL